MSRQLFGFLAAIAGAVLGILPLAGEAFAQSLPGGAGEDVRGVVRPANMATISTDLLVPVLSLPFKQGQRFKRDELLIEFDCAKYEAERGSLLAEHKIRTLTVDNNKTLFGHQAIGGFELEISQAEAERAQSSVALLDARLKGCRIHAPFDGFVSELMVRQYETPTASTPIITIINDNATEIELIAPSDWLRWLAPGAEFDFSVDETGKKYRATVTRINPAVDPVSQTIKLFARFMADDGDIRAGMSGTARFQLPQG